MIPNVKVNFKQTIRNVQVNLKQTLRNFPKNFKQIIRNFSFHFLSRISTTLVFVLGDSPRSRHGSRGVKRDGHGDQWSRFTLLPATSAKGSNEKGEKSERLLAQEAARLRLALLRWRAAVSSKLLNRCTPRPRREVRK